MINTKIFLASSSELKEDRMQFEILLGRINNSWTKRGRYIELVIWENFLDALSTTRLQNEYNKAITSCEIFVMLFFTKVGMYTGEEFETALKHFRTYGRPYLFTYFKNASVNIGDLNENDMISLFGFKKRLKELGHFYSTYTGIDDLKNQFNAQLGKLIELDLFVQPVKAFTPELQQRLEKEREYCQTNNIYMYAASLLRSLLQNSHGLTSASLNKAKSGYGKLLRIKLDRLIEEELIKAKKAKPFLAQPWSERKEVQLAHVYAENDRSELIAEKHLLLGVIEAGGGTIRMMRKDIGEESWTIFLNCIHAGNSNDTPVDY